MARFADGLQATLSGPIDISEAVQLLQTGELYAIQQDVMRSTPSKHFESDRRTCDLMFQDIL